MHETSSPISQQTNNTSHIASVKVRLSWKSESDSPLLLAWPLLSSTSSSWSTLKIGFLLLLLLPMLLFTLRLFCCCCCCCYCCCYLPFFFSFFALFLGQRDNSICALSHVQWNVAPTSQTDLSARTQLRYDFSFLSFPFSVFFSATFSLSFDGSLLARPGCNFRRFCTV